MKKKVVSLLLAAAMTTITNAMTIFLLRSVPN